MVPRFACSLKDLQRLSRQEGQKDLLSIKNLIQANKQNFNLENCNLVKRNVQASSSLKDRLKNLKTQESVYLKSEVREEVPEFANDDLIECLECTFKPKPRQPNQLGSDQRATLPKTSSYKNVRQKNDQWLQRRKCLIETAERRKGSSAFAVPLKAQVKQSSGSRMSSGRRKSESAKGEGREQSSREFREHKDSGRESAGGREQKDQLKMQSLFEQVVKKHNQSKARLEKAIQQMHRQIRMLDQQ